MHPSRWGRQAQVAPPDEPQAPPVAECTAGIADAETAAVSPVDHAAAAEAAALSHLAPSHLVLGDSASAYSAREPLTSTISMTAAAAQWGVTAAADAAATLVAAYS